MEDDGCRAMLKTRPGNRCRFRAKGNGSYCGHHTNWVARGGEVYMMQPVVAERVPLDTLSKSRVVDIIAKESAKLDDFPPLPEKKATWIRSKLTVGPGKRDTIGFIYIYDLLDKSEKLPPNHYKIGRTIRDPEIRMKEWKGAHLIATWRVTKNVYAETLIHLFLGEQRVYRCARCKAVFDPAHPPERCIDGQRHHIRQIEWFHVKLEVAKECIEKVTRYINKNWPS